MSSTDSKASKVQQSFQNLAKLAPAVNAASDELTKAVRSLEESLKNLNIGLPAWVTFEDRADEPETGEYNLKQIGYTKVRGDWGISLRHIWGDESRDEHREDGPWQFSDAPREWRLQSVDKIPELIEELGKEAVNFSKRVQAKTKDVRELAAAISSVADGAKGRPLTPAERATAAELGLVGNAIGINELMARLKAGGK